MQLVHGGNSDQGISSVHLSYALADHELTLLMIYFEAMLELCSFDLVELHMVA